MLSMPLGRKGHRDMLRCDKQMAHQKAAQEDPQGSQEGCLHWSLASQQDPVHRSQVSGTIWQKCVYD